MLIDERFPVEDDEIDYTLHYDEEEGGWHFHHIRFPAGCLTVKCLEVMEEHVFGKPLHEIDADAIADRARTYSLPALHAGAELIRAEQERRSSGG